MNCHLRAGLKRILCGQHWLLHDKSYPFNMDNGILGRIPLNCLGGQLLLRLLFCRVHTTLAKLCAGNCIKTCLWNRATSITFQAWDPYGWPCDGEMDCTTLWGPSKAHVQEVTQSQKRAPSWSHNHTTCLARSLGALGFERNGSSSLPYSQKLALSFTTSRWIMELKSIELLHTFVSKYQDIPEE